MNDEKKKELTAIIKQRVWIENTRMLFDFMQALSDRCMQGQTPGAWKYQGYNGVGGLQERKNIYDKLAEKVEEVLQLCNSNRESPLIEEYLALNPLSSYLSFYHELFPNDTYQEIAFCLQYFNTLRHLAEDIENTDAESTSAHDALPYLYEDLCFSIKEMAQCHATYMVYSEKGETGKLISRSGYIVSKNKNEKTDIFSSLKITQEAIDRIILAARESKEGKDDFVKESVTKGVSIIKSKKEEQHTFLIICLPLSNRNNQSERFFHLLLDYTGEKEKLKNQKNIILKVLFLRYRLLEALTNDYAKLIAFRYDYSYIQSVRDTDRVEERPRILHISDMHLNAANALAYKNGVQKLLTEDGSLRQEFRGIDFLAITGDVVDASNNAADAQKKYEKAADFLHTFITLLWGKRIQETEEIALPHDWKRRVLIVPGNHDYASMSDVIVEAESRKIKAAFPSKRSAGTMSKFTYYIEFVAKYLDVPIVELVSHDMNEVRHYRNMHLKVGLFNSVAKTNSLQNNKVGFCDSEKLDIILEKRGWKSRGGQDDYRLVLMHHSPNYIINYFDDKYEPWEIDEIKHCWQDSDSMYQILIKKFMNLDTIDAGGLCKYFDNKTKERLEDEIGKNIDKDDLKLELYNDMQMLSTILKNGKVETEFEFEFFSRNQNLATIGRKDQEQFKAECGHILDSPDITVLAGHEHQTCCEDFYITPEGRDFVEVYLTNKTCARDSGDDEVFCCSILSAQRGMKYERTVYKYFPKTDKTILQICRNGICNDRARCKVSTNCLVR